MRGPWPSGRPAGQCGRSDTRFRAQFKQDAGQLRSVALDARFQLKRVVETDSRPPSIVSSVGEVVNRLENEVSTLHDQLEAVQNGIRATKHFLREQSSYTREVGEQRARLASLGLYTGSSDMDHICPLCQADLETPTPAATDLVTSLEQLNAQLEAVAGERPHLQERLAAFDAKRLEVEKALVSTQEELQRAYAEDERARLQRDKAIERARVVGRVSGFLEQFIAPDESMVSIYSSMKRSSEWTLSLSTLAPVTWKKESTRS